MQKEFVVICLISLVSMSCSIRPGSLRKLHKTGVVTQARDFTATLSDNAHSEANATYLGCGGLLLQKNGKAILIDPFFSNQKTGRIGRSVFLGRRGKALIRPDKTMVEAGLQTIERNLRGGTVHAILSAHSHYDHLMDIPFVYEYLKREPRLLLTKSGYNIIHRTVDSADVSLSEMFSADHTRSADPFEIELSNGKIQIYPIRSAHNPHFKNIKFFAGEQSRRVDEFSSADSRTKANLWLEGNTFSFLIDFLNEDDAIEFRAFIQSSSCNAPAGLPPSDLLARHPVDVAFLGVVSYQFSPGYPCEILSAISPRQIVWIHWEDFFRRYDRDPKTVRGTNVPAFFRIPCVDQQKTSAKILWPRVNMRLVY
jgi:hypothetical protein